MLNIIIIIIIYLFIFFKFSFFAVEHIFRVLVTKLIF